MSGFVARRCARRAPSPPPQRTFFLPICKILLIIFIVHCPTPADARAAAQRNSRGVPRREQAANLHAEGPLLLAVIQCSPRACGFYSRYLFFPGFPGRIPARPKLSPACSIEPGGAALRQRARRWCSAPLEDSLVGNRRLGLNWHHGAWQVFFQHV